MSLKDLDLKTSYDSDEDDILNEFYIPILSESVKYKRIAGYFTSTSLAIASKGIAQFILNGGKIELIANVVLSQEDYEEMKKITEKPFLEKAEKEFIESLENIENELIKNHVKMLGWMLKNKKLEIKISFVSKGLGIHHQKTGIFQDAEGNMISFSGSDNETKSGWINNIEEFKVFKSWKESEEKYFNSDIKRFEKFWNNKANRTKVYPISEAVSKKLIKIAPKTEHEFEKLSKEITNELLSKVYKKEYFNEERGGIKLRYYQKDAISSWFKNKNKGFFEMATGTGKTITAISCAKELIKEKNNMGIMVAVPSNPLVEQWKNELKKADIDDSLIICCSSNYNWHSKFDRYCLLETNENKFFIFTYQSLSNQEVQEVLSKSKRDFLIICDEMHHAGAPKFSECLNKRIKYRLGLSATPIRKYDVEGNNLLLDYFGKEPLMAFDIEKALKEINPETKKTYLCPYNYHFETVELTDSEHKDYRALSQRIFLEKMKKGKENEGQADKMRALLVSCASEKILILDELIKEIKSKGEIKKILFYCQSFKSKDLGEKQIESVKKVIGDNNLNFLEFTSKFDDILYRKKILNALKTDIVDCIVSMKCLDEGIDLPDIRTAVILASSSNSAQFIQRRGRILRNASGKKNAEIYDFLVGPPIEVELKKSDISLIRKEYERAEEYAKYAINFEDLKKNLNRWLNKYKLSKNDLYEDE